MFYKRLSAKYQSIARRDHKNRSFRCIHIYILICFCLTLTFSCPIYARIVFTKIADINTPIPEGTGNFTRLEKPVIDGNNFAFWANNYTSQEGIFISVNGNLQKVAMYGDYMPSYCGIKHPTFREFGSVPSLSGQNVCFSGDGKVDNCDMSGIYTNLGGFLSIIADIYTQVPGQPLGITFGANWPWIDGENIAFWGAGDGWQGMYKKIGGNILCVADTNTTIPGKSCLFYKFGNGHELNMPRISNGSVVFIGEDNCGIGRGVYTDLGGTLKLVADTNTLVPGSGSTFSNYFMGCYIKDEVILFVGSYGQNYGIYNYIDGVINEVAVYGDPISNENGRTIKKAWCPSISDSNIVAFKGYTQVGGNDFKYGLYAKVGNKIIKVVENGDLLDGNPVSIDISWGNNPDVSISNNNIVFSSSKASIYVAALPDTMIDEEFDIGQDLEEDLGFDVNTEPNTGIAEIVVDANDPNNGLLRMYDPNGNQISITKTVVLYDFSEVTFGYKFITDGTLDIIFSDESYCKIYDTIIAPESGPGRDSFAEYQPTSLLELKSVIPPIALTFELKLRGSAEVEILIDDLSLTTNQKFPYPPLFGDINNDRKIDLRDFAYLANNWLLPDTPSDIAPSPFGDEMVDILDLEKLCENWLNAIEN